MKRLPGDDRPRGAGGRAVADEGDVARGTAHVEGERPRGPGLRGGPARTDHAPGGPAQDGPRGVAGRLAERDQPSVGLHDRGRRKPGVARATLESFEVAADDRRQRRIDRGGRDPLVLPDLGEDLGRRAHGHVRERRPEGRGEATLVLGVRVRMEQSHRDGVHVEHPHGRHDPRDLVLGQRDEHAVRAVALTRLDDTFARDDGRRVVHVEAVEIRPPLAAELEQVAEALRRHECRPRPRALQQRVRADGHAVREPRDGGRGPVRGAQCGPDRRDHADALVVGGRRHLSGGDGAAGYHHGVGEGPADVDAHQDAWGLWGQRLYHRRPLWHDRPKDRPVTSRRRLAAAFALAGLAVVGTQAHAGVLPAERTLRVAPTSPGADGLGGWTWAGRRVPAPVERGARTLVRLELNTSLISPPVWVPAAAQALSIVTRSPGGGTLLVVRAEPLDGSRAVELGVLEPTTRPSARRVALGPVAGRPVRLVLDPVTAFGRVVEVGEVGPFVTTMPGWRVTRGLALRRTGGRTEAGRPRGAARGAPRASSRPGADRRRAGARRGLGRVAGRRDAPAAGRDPELAHASRGRARARRAGSRGAPRVARCGRDRAGGPGARGPARGQPLICRA